MRRLSGVLLAGAILLLPAFSQHASAQNAPQKTTYSGDAVIAAYVVNAGKEADYEKVIATLKDSLAKSTKPAKAVKAQKPPPGSTNLIDPNEDAKPAAKPCNPFDSMHGCPSK